MEILLALLFGVLLAGAVHLLLARSLPRVILGLLLLGNAANIALLAGGRVLGTAPPLVSPGAQALAAGAANPLPQALVLTAIVMVLAWAVWKGEAVVDAEALRSAEPRALPSTDPAEDAEAEPGAEPR
jgi:multisubunit Na+/H+ antiporter MnhC subunit